MKTVLLMVFAVLGVACAGQELGGIEASQSPAEAVSEVPGTNPVKTPESSSEPDVAPAHTDAAVPDAAQPEETPDATPPVNESYCKASACSAAQAACGKIAATCNGKQVNCDDVFGACTGSAICGGAGPNRCGNTCVDGQFNGICSSHGKPSNWSADVSCNQPVRTMLTSEGYVIGEKRANGVEGCIVVGNVWCCS